VSGQLYTPSIRNKSWKINLLHCW